MKTIAKGVHIDYDDIWTARLSMVVDKFALKDMPDLSKPVTVEIKAYRKRRTLSANAYCWVLAEKIAEKIRSTKLDVYRAAVKEVGVFDTVYIPIAAAERYSRIWEKNGDGWIAERIYSALPEAACYHCYYGSSTYNTAEMSRLIDWLIDAAEEQGIDTLTPNEKSLMLQEWRNTNG